MFDLSLKDIAENMHGKLIAPDGKMLLEPSGASIDTRTLQPGDLFFAFPGEKANGHKFLQQAMEKGAAGAVVSHIPQGMDLGDFPVIIVEDAKHALQQTAHLMRHRFRGPVIAVTGSTGKTTTKDMLWTILSEKGPALRNIGNMNNELGLPLTLLTLRKEHWAIILEMGMRGLGEIEFLAYLSEPSYGIITNVGHTHQELLGSQENIAKAKAELLPHIPEWGAVVLNVEDKVLLQPWLANIRGSISWIGENSAADIWAEDVLEQREDGLQGVTTFSVCTRQGLQEKIRLPVSGRHNALNALAAVALAKIIGLNWQEIVTGLAKLELNPMRLEFKYISARDIILINDAYNANPASMLAAIEVLAARGQEGNRTIAVLGDMYELGDYEKTGHIIIGEKVSETKIAYLITVGKLAEYIAQGAKNTGMLPEKVHICYDNSQALDKLKELIKPGDVVLVKGSRGVKMEEIVRGL